MSRLIYNYYFRSFPLGWTMNKAHKHEAIEIICCLEGKINIWVKNKKSVVTINKGDCTILQQGVTHRMFLEKNVISECVCVQINRNSVNFTEHKTLNNVSNYDIFNDNAYGNKGWIKVLDNESIAESIKRIVQELNSKTDGYASLVKSEIIGLIIRIARNLEKQRKFRYDEDNLYNQYINHAIEYMKQNMLNQIAPQDIAENIHISANHLMHIFNNKLNKSVMQILRELRIERGKHLLAITSLSISETAYQCGYQSLQHFSTAFKKLTGLTPSMYRRNSHNIDYLKSK